MSCYSSRAPTPEFCDFEELYALNFEKIKKGCKENWFGSTSLEFGTSPKDIIIHENEPLHFVQLLFVLKEMCWLDDRWMLFTKNGLLSILKKDEKIYLENDRMFGRKFVDQFPSQVKFFLENYCDVVGEY